MSHVINSHDMGTWDFHVTFYFFSSIFFPYKYQSIWNFFHTNVELKSSYKFFIFFLSTYAS